MKNPAKIYETAMEPYRKNQIPTQAALEAHGCALLEAVQAVMENSKDGGGINPHYATVTNAALYFGMSLDSMKRKLPALMRKHKIRVTQMRNPDGSPDKPRYNLQDLEAAFLREREELERA